MGELRGVFLHNEAQRRLPVAIMPHASRAWEGAPRALQL